MAVNVVWERTNGVLVGQVAGRVDGSNAAELQSALDAQIGSGDDALLLDFENLTFISSAGLRVGLAAAKKFNESGKKFGVCTLSSSVQDVVTVSGFNQIISVYESRSKALAYMGNS